MNFQIGDTVKRIEARDRRIGKVIELDLVYQRAKVHWKNDGYAKSDGYGRKSWNKFSCLVKVSHNT
ncbi:MAG: hypothetical protein QNJ60_06095 [Xenococcaceae cyanobacterium MO_188.B19]|nr:hypothetical protein [Xenococcaceae cyanobacterium MO_188.B19]